VFKQQSYSINQGSRAPRNSCLIMQIIESVLPLAGCSVADPSWDQGKAWL